MPEPCELGTSIRKSSLPSYLILIIPEADGVEVPSSVWRALLGACRIHNNLEVGKIAGKNVLKLESLNSGVYMILAEMYTASVKRFQAEKIWYERQKRE
ncbi:hypothetical protein DCAR_0207778 [Daucus carota subsp. sativus]|uniref:Uncharacterized protein n=1 Tax=Daucus carota subsp. sativus TaxID=79200 RepID=A0AAF1AMU2_DAUCS|nr:hypothetical protein DCAR_0207778 [Daucus carota subsp. sativus]